MDTFTVKERIIQFELNLNFSNVFTVIDFVTKNGLQAAVEQCFRFLESNWSELMADHNVFARTTFKSIVDLFKSLSRISEVQQIQFLLKWHDSNANVPLKDLLRLVRWSEVTAGVYSVKIRPLNVVTDDEYFEYHMAMKSPGFSYQNLANILIEKYDKTVKADDHKVVTVETARVRVTDVQREQQIKCITYPIERQCESVESGCQTIARRHNTFAIRYYCDHCKQDFVDEQRCLQHIKFYHENVEKQVEKLTCVLKNTVASEPLKPAVTIPLRVQKRKYRSVYYSEKANKEVKVIMVNGSKQFVCKICEKVFSHGADRVRRHVSTVHLNEKPYCCEYCGARFTQQPNLHEHYESVHIGVRCYNCDICNKLYKTKKQVQRHIREVHSSRVVCFCEICGVRYTSKQSLKNHIRIKHGKQMEAIEA